MNELEMVILKMLGSFPQTAGDAEIMLGSMLDAANKFDDVAVYEACERFRLGKINRNHAFAPSVAEFSKEAEELHTWFKKQKENESVRRALPKPNIPLSERLEGIRAQYAHRKVLAEDISHEDFTKGARRKLFPEKSTWVASLATVFAPPSIIKQQEGA